MFEVKKVVGGRYPDTEYDPYVQQANSREDAIEMCHGITGTKDIFENGERIARVHVDGGIDYLKPTWPS